MENHESRNQGIPDQDVHHHGTNILSLTIIFNGNPKIREYPSSELVRTVIVDNLPEADRKNADKYMLTDSSQKPPKELNPDRSLEQDGVCSGNVLSLTKKDGGGGNDRPSTLG